ncbi:hypothetical protein LCGC14_1985380 [marine sediment metagenome]|uniref:Uncharacterized protein n=1 Tax=marine sediment metagenome TaxID=412755 RepID=A0A0F9HKY2_9ZZZZ
MILNRYEIKEMVMQILAENEQDLPSKSGRGLFWFRLKGVFSTWIYMLGKTPIASVWRSDDEWRYSVLICDQVGNEELREDAMARAETHIAESKSAYITALG